MQKPRYRTYRFAALRADLGVVTNDRQLRDTLNSALVDLKAAGSPAYQLEATLVDDDVYELVGPSGSPRRRVHRGRILSQVINLLNHRVIAESADTVLIHAAAATNQGVTTLLPAPMESGKTTTVAGLLLRGWQYLSDEAIAIEPGGLRVNGYPKPLSIDGGSWPTLRELRPRDPFGFFQNQWQVPASSIGVEVKALASPPTLLIAPRYEPQEATTRLDPMSRGNMLKLLAESTFATGAPPRQALRTLARLTDRCQCYSLVVGDLGTAVGLIHEVAVDCPSTRR
jgi:hypothetical protein